jgi:hypothetical protein
VYALDNPTSRTDPRGLCANSCEGGTSSKTGVAFLGSQSSGLDEFYNLLPDYLSCVQLGVSIAILALEFSNPVTTTLAVNAYLAAVASNGDPASFIGGTASGASASGPVVTREYTKKFAQSLNEWGGSDGKVLEGSAEAAAGLGSFIGFGLTAYSGFQCAKDTGIWDLLTGN